MINASQEYKDAIARSSRSFRAQFLDAQGDVLEGSLVALTLRTGACSDLPQPGAIFSSYVEATIYNAAAPLFGKMLTLQIGVVTEQDEIEYISTGKFKVTKTSAAGVSTSFTAVGTLTAKCSGPYESSLTYPTALSNVITEIQTKAGIAISTKGLTISGTLEKKIEGDTYAGALATIASLLGGFVTEDHQGNVVIAAFGAGDTYAIDLSRFGSRPSYTENEYEVTGITCVVSVDTEDEEGTVTPGVSYTYGTPNVVITNPYMTQALFNVMAPRYTGLAFYPAQVPLTLGNPLLEPWDVLSITDTDGTVRTTPCNVIEHSFTGGFSQQITAELAGDSDDSDALITGPVSKELADLNTALLVAQQAIINRATIAQLNAAIASIDTGYINKAIIGDAEVTDLTATKAEITRLLVNTFTSAQIQTILLDFDQATGGSLTLDNLEADKAEFESLLATDFTASQIEAISAVFSEVATTSLVTESLTTKYAKIDFANIGVETVSELFVNTGFLSNATIQDGKITGTLGAVQVTADLIEVNTIVAGDLLVQSQDDPNTYYRINLEESQITREDIPADQMAQYLSGNDIIAHSITTREITAENLQGTGGWINLAEGTFRYTNAEAGTGVSWDGSQFQVLSGAGTGTMPIVASYIDSTATEFGPAWLTDAEGTTLTPAADTVYLIQTEGDYYGQFFLWSGTEYQTYDVYGQGVTSESLIGAVGDASTAVQKTSSMTYENGVLSLGGYGAFKITIGNLGPDSRPRLSFWQGDVEVAYINNNEMYIKQTIVLEAMDIGDWRWKKQANGNLTLQWIGG